MNEKEHKKGFAGLSSLTSKVERRARNAEGQNTSERRDKPPEETKRAEPKPSASSAETSASSSAPSKTNGATRGPHTSSESSERASRWFWGIVSLGVLVLLISLGIQDVERNTSGRSYSSPKPPSPARTEAKPPPSPRELIDRNQVTLETSGVCALQEALSKLGLYKMRIDGKPGPGTRAAMKALADQIGYDKQPKLTRGWLRGAQAVLNKQPGSSRSVAATSLAPLPAHGTVLATRGSSIAPLQLITPGGGYYYVKLVDVGTGQSVKTIFVHGGRTLEIDVPLGTYRMRYAFGPAWYGETCLFGAETEYSEADSNLRFYRTGYQVAGHTIELIRQVGGNLDSRHLTASEF